MYIQKIQYNTNSQCYNDTKSKKAIVKPIKDNKSMSSKIVATTIGGSVLLAIGILHGAKGLSKLKQTITKLTTKSKNKVPTHSQADIEKERQQIYNVIKEKRKQAEENSKIATEKLEKEKLSREVQIKPEKLVAEKGIQETKIAQELATQRQIHANAISQIDDYIFKHTAKINPNTELSELSTECWQNRNLYNKTKGTIDDITMFIKNAEAKGDNFSTAEIKKILNNLQSQQLVDTLIIRVNKPIKKTEPYWKNLYNETEKDFSHCSKDIIERIVLNNIEIDKNTIRSFIANAKNKNDYLGDIIKLIDDIPKEGTEKASDYLTKITTKHIELMQKRNDAFNQMIKSKISYATGNIENNVITLTKEERQQVINEINKIFKTSYTADVSIGAMADYWKQAYISGHTPNLSPKVETALLEQFSKYETKTGSVFEKEPVYRWMRITNIDDFLRQFSKDSQYSYPKLQSCSKLKECGEFKKSMRGTFINFADNESNYNVKFVIHPKGKTTKARMLGMGKYGDNEVIYPNSQKFRVLGKINKEVNPQDFNQNSLLKDINFEPFRRWEIHLQEI